jgi:transposase-like protein
MAEQRLTAEQKEAIVRECGDTTHDLLRVSAKYNIHERTLWGWKRKYDGTLESLTNKSSRPLRCYREHTQDEIIIVTKALKENPNCGLLELFSILKRKYNYTRTYSGMMKFLYKNGYTAQVVAPRKKWQRDTPPPADKKVVVKKQELLGYMQMDVRKLPGDCYTGKDKKPFYLFHMIDEATLEKFIYPYDSNTEQNVIDFCKRALHFYGYMFEQIKNESIGDFADYITHRQGRDFKKLCFSLEINPLFVSQSDIPLLRRSHKTEHEKLYPDLRFSNYDELKAIVGNYVERINNIVSTRLKVGKVGTKNLLTPREQKATTMASDLGDELTQRYKDALVRGLI